MIPSNIATLDASLSSCRDYLLIGTNRYSIHRQDTYILLGSKCNPHLPDIISKMIDEDNLEMIRYLYQRGYLQWAEYKFLLEKSILQEKMDFIRYLLSVKGYHCEIRLDHDNPFAEKINQVSILYLIKKCTPDVLPNILLDMSSVIIICH
jgi:hypothetical protein